MELEALLAYGATRRGCGQLREHLGVTTVQVLGELVDGFREARRQYPRAGYRFHLYLGCPNIGPDTGDRLLQAYERWHESAVHQRKYQDEPHPVMV